MERKKVGIGVGIEMGLYGRRDVMVKGERCALFEDGETVDMMKRFY